MREYAKKKLDDVEEVKFIYADIQYMETSKLSWIRPQYTVSPCLIFRLSQNLYDN